jgi:hypothetical protein
MQDGVCMGFEIQGKPFAVKPMFSRLDGIIAYAKKKKNPKTLNPKNPLNPKPLFMTEHSAMNLVFRNALTNQVFMNKGQDNPIFQGCILEHTDLGFASMQFFLWL